MKEDSIPLILSSLTGFALGLLIPIVAFEFKKNESIKESLKEIVASIKTKKIEENELIQSLESILNGESVKIVSKDDVMKEKSTLSPQEKNISLFNIKEESVMISILQHLNVEDLVKFDSAIICRSNREFILNCYGNLILYEQINNINTIKWLRLRMISLKRIKIIIPSVSIEEYASVLLDYLTNCGSCVQSLNYGCEFTENNYFLPSFFHDLVNLKELYLNGTFPLTLEIVNAITHNCRKIEILDISLDKYQINESFAKQLFSAFSLKELTLHFFIKENDDHVCGNSLLFIIGQCQVNLKRLMLSFSYENEYDYNEDNFPLDGFMSLISNCHKLEEIHTNFYGLMFLNAHELNTISENLPNLKRFTNILMYVNFENSNDDEIASALINLSRGCPFFQFVEDEDKNFSSNLADYVLSDKILKTLLERFSFETIFINKETTSNAFLHLNNNSKSISSLKYIGRCDNEENVKLDGTAILFMLKKMYKLESLNLSNCRCIDDETFKQITLKNGSRAKLTSLNIISTSVSEIGIPFISKSFPYLKKLFLSESLLTHSLVTIIESFCKYSRLGELQVICEGDEEKKEFKFVFPRIYFSFE